MNIVPTPLQGTTFFNGGEVPSDTYTEYTGLDGNHFIFNSTFIHLIRYALSTMCLTEMSDTQRKLFLTYVDSINGNVFPTPVTKALDTELVNISLCIDAAGNVICGNSGLHTYVACSVDINL